MARILQILLVVLPQIFTILALILSLAVSYPGSLVGRNVDARYLALIDTSEVTIRVGSDDYRGLPDSHDFSRHKEFFSIYANRYCSGYKVDNKYRQDFCSRIGSELFDQFRIWRVWGVDLAESRNAKDAVEKSIGVTAIKTLPRAIFIWHGIASGLLVIGVIVGLASFCSPLAKKVAVALTLLATMSALVVASLSQSLFPTLVNRTNNYRVSDSILLTSKLGVLALWCFWTEAILSLVASVLWFVALRRQKSKTGGPDIKVKRATTIEMIPGIVRRATGGLVNLSPFGDTSYEKVREDSRLWSASRNGSQDDLVAEGRGSSQLDANKGFKDESDSEDVSNAGRDRQKFEPLRHRKMSE